MLKPITIIRISFYIFKSHKYRKNTLDLFLRQFFFTLYTLQISSTEIETDINIALGKLPKNPLRTIYFKTIGSIIQFGSVLDELLFARIVTKKNIPGRPNFDSKANCCAVHRRIILFPFSLYRDSAQRLITQKVTRRGEGYTRITQRALPCTALTQFSSNARVCTLHAPKQYVLV